MNAGIAAFRAGNAPHIMQVFEVGTATMMSATGAVKPVHVLMKEAGEAFDPKTYLPTITGYYSTTKGEMLSMPFNSSSTVMWYNKDAFKKAGLDPDKPPKTWPEVFDAAKKLKAAGHPNCGFGNAWVTWVNLEQLSAWHNVPLATKANGMDGFDTELKFNSPLHVQAPARTWSSCRRTRPTTTRAAPTRARAASPRANARSSSPRRPSSATSRPTPSSTSATRRCPTIPTSPARRRTPSSAAPRCG